MSYQTLKESLPDAAEHRGERPLFSRNLFRGKSSQRRRRVLDVLASAGVLREDETLHGPRVPRQHVRGLFRRYGAIWRAPEQSGVELLGRDVSNCGLRSGGHMGESGPPYERGRPADAKRFAPVSQVHAGVSLVQRSGMHYGSGGGARRPVQRAHLSGVRRALFVVSRPRARLVPRAPQSRARSEMESDSNHVQIGHSRLPQLQDAH
jgi:hypothetical protein